MLSVCANADRGARSGYLPPQLRRSAPGERNAVSGHNKPRPPWTGPAEKSRENQPEARGSAYALATLPLLMQLVHTRMRFGAPLTRALTACRLTFQRRRVTLCA